MAFLFALCQSQRRSAAIPVYVYRCSIPDCAYWQEERQSFADPRLSVCPACSSPTYQRVPQVPAMVHVKGSRMVNGELRLRRPKVIREGDGSETVYGSVREATLNEYERAPHPRVAKKNIQDLKAHGLIPGTREAAFAAALEEPRR